MILRPLFLAAAIFPLAPFVSAQTTTSAGTLLQFDFDGEIAWPQTSPKPYSPGVLAGEFGTIDVADSVKPSGGLRLIAQSPLAGNWNAQLKSGPLALQNTESHLGKLTLAFSLSATRALPVKVIVESYNEQKERTGGLEVLIYPAAADFYQRHALDLSLFTPVGEGVFDPVAPAIGFTFEIGSATGWPSATRQELLLDNVHFAKPAYYVAPAGSDANDGRTETTAFLTPQKALQLARPGDIILLAEGTYGRAEGQPARTPVARFVRPGTPAGWITLKNLPGHQPVLSSAGQVAVNITRGIKGSPEEDAILAYIEVRGLHVRGNSDTVREQFPDEIGRSTPNTDTQGIVINGRRTGYPGERKPGEIVHHIRLCDNVVEFCTADGVYVEYADWLFLERNTIRDNCRTTVGYAPSGLAVMGHANFDALDNVHKMLISGNTVSGNRLEVKNHPWGKGDKTSYFNGNGILLDANAEIPPAVYLGRTLVQNNVVFNNGAGGIQMWANHRMDLVNNTLYKNGTVLPWGEIGFERCRDVGLVNNIVVARPDRPLDTWMINRLDSGTSRITRVNNLYWGGIARPVEGIGDLVADPLFINEEAGDFRLRAESPARHSGRWEHFTPAVDHALRARPNRGSPDRGAHQN